ncbi:hypothetical protein ACLOJK_026999, partial [Asimina triloba]
MYTDVGTLPEYRFWYSIFPNKLTVQPTAGDARSPLFPQDPMNFIDDGHFQVVQAVIFFKAIVVVFSGDPSPPSSSWRIGPLAAIQAAMENPSMAGFSPNRVRVVPKQHPHLIATHFLIDQQRQQPLAPKGSRCTHGKHSPSMQIRHHHIWPSSPSSIPKQRSMVSSASPSSSGFRNPTATPIASISRAPQLASSSFNRPEHQMATPSSLDRAPKSHQPASKTQIRRTSRRSTEPSAEPIIHRLPARECPKPGSVAHQKQIDRPSLAETHC